VVTDAIRQTACGALTFYALGPRSVKGFAEPVDAFRASRPDRDG
jgi:class 3 adenylate cyclase